MASDYKARLRVLGCDLQVFMGMASEDRAAANPHHQAGQCELRDELMTGVRDLKAALQPCTSAGIRGATSRLRDDWKNMFA
ncbi:hypothetical protein MAXJ12_30792 [Mesorhizobium alhagi CCNWXJ12-2]|uniref:Uncharacterized protein n=1 Tax=Mesorhizobium alhagi CCNWXJ12-2 TaxID=1107882 RepID=H0I121_9HYPH|nr:hypothetical protein MAXJ12_30792 [Mesorhizobium alhagi CCNWXJ12-2]